MVPRSLLAIATALAVPGGVASAGAPPAGLWATINACDPPERRATVGVRVAVPPRGAAAQWVRIRLQFFDRRRRAWRLVRMRGADGYERFSRGGGTVTGGATFSLSPPRAGTRLTLRGLVDVQWRRGRRVALGARVLTTGGHANPADPLLRTSQPRCVLAR